MNSAPSPRVLIAAIATTGALFGCVDSNDRESIGREVVLGSLSGADTPSPEAVAAGGSDDAPSLVSLDRSNWPSETFLVPVDGTDHHPNYTRNLAYTNVTARQRNEQPTPATALELDGTPESDAANQRLAEAIFSPFWALGEAIAILPRLVIEPQTKVVQSPLESYPRVRIPPALPTAVEVPPTTPTTPATTTPANPPTGTESPR